MAAQISGGILTQIGGLSSDAVVGRAASFWRCAATFVGLSFNEWPLGAVLRALAAPWPRLLGRAFLAAPSWPRLGFALAAAAWSDRKEFGHDQSQFN